VPPGENVEWHENKGKLDDSSQTGQMKTVPLATQWHN
jgi:hypothetical protein